MIQAVALCELDGLQTPTYEGGHLPFRDLTSLIPNEAYFDHLRRVTDIANSRDLYIALVPMWGSHWSVNNSWGAAKTPLFNAENVQAFCRYLSDKLQGTGIIWMIGGDRAVQTPEQGQLMENMAQGLRQGGSGDALLTVHSQGGRSTLDMLGDRPWHDFIVWQSGHMGEAYPSWRAIEMDYQRQSKPVLDAEPCYEAHPIMCQHQFRRAQEASRFTDREVRRSSYWSVFAGARALPMVATVSGRCADRKMTPWRYLKAQRVLIRAIPFRTGLMRLTIPAPLPLASCDGLLNPCLTGIYGFPIGLCLSTLIPAINATVV